MAKRILCAILALVLLFCFTACSQNQTPLSPDISGEQSKKTDAATFARLSELEGCDYGGREFRIAAYQLSGIFPENNDTALNTKLGERNRAVEEKFGIKLKNAAIPQETFFSTLRDACDAGEDVCDIVVAPRSMAASFVAGDMLLNVRSLPGINYSYSYFDSAAMDAASLGSVSYEIAGEYVYSPTSYWAVCYNQELMEWFGFTDFVTLARGGQWTMDLFYKYIHWFYKDQNGDRVMTDKDLFGCTASVSEETLWKILWAASGKPFFKNDPPDAPEMDFAGEDTQEMISLIRKILETPGRYEEGAGGMSALDLFLSGQSLFYICPASTVGYLQLQGMNVGMLPLPKFTAEQEHFYAYVDPSAPVVYVLNTCRDTEFVARVLQGLFAASEDLTFDSTVETYSAFRLTGNAAVNFFIDMIRHGYYDPAFVLGDAFPEVHAASGGIVHDVLFLKGNFDTLYENQLTAFNETYAKEKIHSRKSGEWE